MTLGEVLITIREAYEIAYESVKDFMYLDEVSSFILRRKKDLDEFQNLTACYSKSRDIVEVQQDLRLRGVESKIYGGICMQKAEYFSVTKKVQRCIEREIEVAEAEKSISKAESKINFDSEYAIFDELSSEDLQKLCEA